MTHMSMKRPAAEPGEFSGRLIRAPQQRGLTMVELLVAMVISLLIALAAIASLTVTRRGFTTVDEASQLRDNGRFIADLIERLGVQSGFKDVEFASQFATAEQSAADPAPSITGFNNALISASDPLNSSTARTTGVEGYGSDILILRNQLVRLNDSNDADGSMIDCSGNTVTAGAAPQNRKRDDRMASVLSVAVSTGEPSLLCTWQSPTTGAWTTQPIIRGVENFQVLYGTEDVTAATAPPATYGITAGASAPTSQSIFTPNPPTTAASAALADWRAQWTTWEASVNQAPDKYLRADQMSVAGNTIATNANWRRVRSLRIGMILRGPANSAQNAVSQTLYPFGLAKSASGASNGSALSSANDPGTIFVAPADGRLRQVVTFTVHLRNQQGL